MARRPGQGRIGVPMTITYVKPTPKQREKHKAAKLRRAQSAARHDALHAAEAAAYELRAPGLRTAAEMVKPEKPAIPLPVVERPPFKHKPAERRRDHAKRGLATLGEILGRS